MELLCLAERAFFLLRVPAVTDVCVSACWRPGGMADELRQVFRCGRHLGILLLEEEARLSL